MRCVTGFVMIAAIGFAAMGENVEVISKSRHEGVLLSFLQTLPVARSSQNHFFINDSEHFVVTSDIQTAETRKLTERLEAGYSRFYIYFRNIGFELRPSSETLAWLCFSNEKYFELYSSWADHQNLLRLGGYYSAKTNRVAILTAPSRETVVRKIYPSGSPAMVSPFTPVGDHEDMEAIKLMHELAHQLAFNAGLQKRGAMYPLWISEGISTAYESTLSDVSQYARCRLLKEMKVQNRLIPLSEFITLCHLPDDTELEKDLYAQAWGFFRFLSQNQIPRLKAYLKAFCNMEFGWRASSSIAAEFINTFGPIQSLQKSWIEFIDSLPEEELIDPGI
jgi:hypothetical protein